jgi:hypothetical protein
MSPQPPCALRVTAARGHIRRWCSSPMLGIVSSHRLERDTLGACNETRCTSSIAFKR